jgi:hypothetical protein
MTAQTLFAGFVFSFSKIFCDWAFVAIAMAEDGAQRAGDSHWAVE